MKNVHKLAALSLAAATLGVFSLSAAAQSYPNRPIKLVVPQAAGGTSDALGRMWGEHVGKALGQPVIVENKPGANGILAASYVAKQPADGYTVILSSVSIAAINPFLYKSLPYNIDKDFEGVSLLVATPYILVANPGTGFKTFTQFAEAAKAKPNALNFASAGKGNGTHLVFEKMIREMNVKLTHVPYNGSAPAMSSVIAGQTDVMLDVFSTSAPNVKSGRLNGLAVLSTQRQKALPDLPTIFEAGVKEFPIPNWYSLHVPAKTPVEIVNKLNAETQAFLNDPAVKAKLENLSLDPIMSKPSDVAVWTKREGEIWGATDQRLGSFQ